MKKNFLNLLNKIDSITAEILDIIISFTEKNKAPFFIVGATARDLYFESKRATIDLDIGIHLTAWESYHKILNGLLETGKFKKSEVLHRIYYIRDDYPVDIVPFGGISEKDGTITWPDENKMSIIGFEEAYQDCYEARISEGKIMKVASPVGLVIMKLISWSESSYRAQKDAEDLDLIFSEYCSLPNNIDRIYEYPEILELVDFDLQRSGIVLLGKDTTTILKNDTRKVIHDIIEKETNDSSGCKLSLDMVRAHRFKENEFERKLQMINDFKTGLNLHEKK